MRKVNAIVTYKNEMDDSGAWFRFVSMSATPRNGENIILVAPSEIEMRHPYKYRNFDALYNSALNLLKNNGFYAAKHTDFGATWYEINFINLDTGAIERHPYHKTLI